jgi:hypothetical protein
MPTPSLGRNLPPVWSAEVLHTSPRAPGRVPATLPGHIFRDTLWGAAATSHPACGTLYGVTKRMLSR